jgi:uncharacterized protein
MGGTFWRVRLQYDRHETPSTRAERTGFKSRQGWRSCHADRGDNRMRAEEPSSTIVSLDDLRRRRDEILTAAARHGIRNVRVFGSVARGQATLASDIDFLVDLERDRSLLDLAGLLVDLEDLLGRRVDVITAPGLKARMRDRVLGDAVSL